MSWVQAPYEASSFATQMESAFLVPESAGALKIQRSMVLEFQHDHPAPFPSNECATIAGSNGQRTATPHQLLYIVFVCLYSPHPIDWDANLLPSVDRRCEWHVPRMKRRPERLTPLNGRQWRSNPRPTVSSKPIPPITGLDGHSDYPT